MEWLAPQQVTVGQVLTLSTTDNPISPYPVGAHGTHREPFETFLPPHCHSRLLILTAEKHDDTMLRITSKVKEIKTKTGIAQQPFMPTTTLFDMLHEQGHDAQHIFTDGSFDQSSSPARGGGAVIFQLNDTTFKCIKIRQDLTITSVFDMELAALAIARVAASTSLVTCSIYSDSKASLGVMSSIDKNEYQKKPLQHALNQPHLYMDTESYRET
jgi:ribonuclease HI